LTILKYLGKKYLATLTKFEAPQLMCISLNPTQEFIDSTIISASFGNIHNITYMMEVSGDENEMGGFIIFPGNNAQLIEPPTICNILKFKDEIDFQYSKNPKFQSNVDNKKTNIEAIIKIFDNLNEFYNSFQELINSSTQLKNLVDSLMSISELQDQPILLCLIPIKTKSAIAFSYTIQGDLLIPGWENDHVNIDYFSPYVERTSTFIVGKTDERQKTLFKQYVSSPFEYCFPSLIANYSCGIEESKNGNLTLQTNRFGWHQLEAA
jgi:hypothetical protein